MKLSHPRDAKFVSMLRFSRWDGDFTLEIVALDDEMLKVRVLEERPAEDEAHVPTDVG